MIVIVNNLDIMASNSDRIIHPGAATLELDSPPEINIVSPFLSRVNDSTSSYLWLAQLNQPAKHHACDGPAP